MPIGNQPIIGIPRDNLIDIGLKFRHNGSEYEKNESRGHLFRPFR